MRTLSFFLVPLIFASFQSFATEHTIASQINYNSEQDANVGYGIFYQYQFFDSVEFEVKYAQSGDLKVIKDENIIFGDYHSFSSGFNFIKQRTPKLSLKAGLGINTVTTSSNNYLIEKNSIAPYFQISANYKMTDTLSFTLGQTSLFHDDNIGTNHSLFLSMNWLFTSQTNTPSIQTTKVFSPLPVTPKPVPVKKASITSIIETPPQYIPQWYVQIGAYQKYINAEKMNSNLRDKYSLVLSVELHNSLYRLLTHSFPDKKSAEEYLDVLQARFQISGFVNKF
jgi:hypothetical protein